jgi:hypothetical protein
MAGRMLKTVAGSKIGLPRKVTLQQRTDRSHSIFGGARARPVGVLMGLDAAVVGRPSSTLE